MKLLRIGTLLAIVALPAICKHTRDGRSTADEPEHERVDLQLRPRLGDPGLPGGIYHAEQLDRAPAGEQHQSGAHRARHGQRSGRPRHPGAVRSVRHLVMHLFIHGARRCPRCVPEFTGLSSNGVSVPEARLARAGDTATRCSRSGVLSPHGGGVFAQHGRQYERYVNLARHNLHSKIHVCGAWFQLGNRSGGCQRAPTRLESVAPIQPTTLSFPPSTEHPPLRVGIGTPIEEQTGRITELGTIGAPGPSTGCERIQYK